MTDGASRENTARTKLIGCILAVSIAVSLATACGVPNLEPSDCTQARDRVREFYSFHFGNDMRPTAENLTLRERFLTGEYAAKLHGNASASIAVDPFTLTEDFPKAFRVGKCSVLEPEKAVQFAVILFWKDDSRSEQKEILATSRYENNDWLIDAVGPKDR